MKYLFSSILLLSVLFLTGCEKADVVENPTSYDAFYIGYGGGWGIDVWYRIAGETVDVYSYLPGDPLPDGDYANPDNWAIVTDLELISELRELETDFPLAAFADLEQSFCPEVAVDGTCLRVGYGTMTPDNATIWFRNGADNEVANAYLVRVNELIH